MVDLTDRDEASGENSATPTRAAAIPTEAAEETVRIRGLSSGGAGVGNLSDGRVVFVPRTAPGDEVRVRVTQGKTRWARGQLRELCVGSPDRVLPACPYYDECGGCSLQHVAYAQQLHWKGDIVKAALKRISHVDVERPEVVPSPKEGGYRSRVTFTMMRLKGGRVVAGFHHLGVPHRIVDVEEGCILPEPAVASVWTGLRRAWGDGARRLPAGRKLRLTLRAVDEGVILVVEGGRGPGRPDVLLREVEGLVAVWADTPESGARLLAGLTHVHDTRFGETVQTGPTTFLQANREASEALHRWVIEQGGVSLGQKVVDAYCGVGLYGRDLAGRGVDVLGIERDAEAAKAAARDAPESFTVWTGAVEDRVAEALPADLVVLNPPRSGVGARVTDVLQGVGPPRLIYVSCDPATLARDIGRLSSSYDVVDVRAFDLFPQTAHVEVVVVLTRTAAAPESGSTAPPENG
jgi:23S rRNA (uracil1939-C5)-methyltransferase